MFLYLKLTNQPKMQLYKLLFCCLVLSTITLKAQQPKKLSSSEIHNEIQKLNFLGNVLFVAAHPDDENTRLISYLANEVKAHTTYLSITRGDGGQNLIGTEFKELLGVLRTQELLAARNVDGGYQRFTRAVDFGFSKHPDETFDIWNKEEVLGDVVWTIRKLRPDVIINRFDHRTPGSTHGHHTGSAMLSVEAFDLAKDDTKYPEQLRYTQPWTPKRLFFNTSWWFYGSREKFEEADKSNLIGMDIGVFYPELGLSNNEIAAASRSQHLCQGFGQMGSRGSETEYVEFLKGSKPKNNNDIFEGINTTWTRVKGGKAIGEILNKIEANFNFTNPSVHIPELLQAYKLLQNVEDAFWRERKLKELKNVILACSGIYLEAGTQQGSASPGSTVKVYLEAVNRSSINAKLNAISVNQNLANLNTSVSLDNNQKKTFEIEVSLPNNSKYTAPYWLLSKGSLGMYKVNDQELIGKPETPTALKAYFNLSINGTDLTIEQPVVYHFSKPDKGEKYEPFVVLPVATASFKDEVILFADKNPQEVTVLIKAGKDNLNGTISLNAPKGWLVSAAQDFTISQKGEAVNLQFTVTPTINESVGELTPVLTASGQTYNQSLTEIDYDHIPKQSVLLPAQSKVVRLDIKKEGENIGYIVGAGDNVPQSLTQIGYNVNILALENIENASDLAQFDGIVMGIRAYNVLNDLKFKQGILLEYVANGGTMIVQYNTANRWASQFENIAPYPITISRDRVTDENAAVRFLNPEHPVLNKPNKILQADFNNWIQERGLYFPNEWSKEFTPILGMNDTGEALTQGSLLVAKYGKGYYVYTGLSFFRELPAGVPGAYKLFANMLSLGKGKE